MESRRPEEEKEKRYLPASGPDPKRRGRLVKELFAEVSPTYDRLNHLLSFRRDIAWRRKTVEMMRFPSKRALLDVATGTGDLAIEAARRHPEIRVEGADFVEAMLELGRRKVEEAGLAARVRLGFGDATALPHGDGSFDVAAIAFGMRNIPDRLAALREMARVVVPGGQVMVLEFTFAPWRGFRGLYRFYLTRILPALARLVVRDASAYHYLVNTILAYPKPEAFDALMAEAGLSEIEHIGLTFGAVYLHIGIRQLQAR
ncbi:MAG TPA: ubiquinone/menaquinone biosynthesis methyltransferase [Rectinemataceae bacterium]|nr:ubiquinone/menaquinone biosynthesis methyltransferase [Rectinemataceae bacterium]